MRPPLEVCQLCEGNEAPENPYKTRAGPDSTRSLEDMPKGARPIALASLGSLLEKEAFDQIYIQKTIDGPGHAISPSLGCSTIHEGMSKKLSLTRQESLSFL